MSGIFGRLNLAGQPVAPEVLEDMRKSMAYWGPDGSGIWHHQNIGLGHLRLRNTPEAGGDSLRHSEASRGVVLSAHARLDNRGSLVAELARSGERSEQIPDSELILRAYLRWGEGCVDQLLGDWAFGLWDAPERKLLLARDHHGISSVYYCRQTRFLAFASSLKGILALRDVPRRPNLLHIAHVLAAWLGDGAQTGYEEVFQLPAAHLLTVTAGQVVVRRYWDPSTIAPLRLGSDREYLEAFLEIYDEAVRCRLRAPERQNPGIDAGSGAAQPFAGVVGATLSGGLDSSSVCALAARELRSRDQRLPVFTSVPAFSTAGAEAPNRFGDETPFVEANRQFMGNVDVQYIRARTVSPMAGMEHALALHEQPAYAPGNLFWIQALLETAQRGGVRILLTGQGGNATISWTGGMQNFWPLVLTGRWRDLWRNSKGMEPDLLRALKRHLVLPLVQPWRDQKVRWQNRHAPPWDKYSAINPRFAQSLDLRGRMLAAGHDPHFLKRLEPKADQLKLIRPGRNELGAIWAETGAGYGMEVRDPTFDKRLIEFCLAVPASQYRVGGQNRALIRRSMAGLLPDVVRLNTRVGCQGADLGHRLLATLPEVRAVMARLERSALAREVLDLPKMNRVLQALQSEVNAETTRQCHNILMRGMMAGLFLLRHE